MYDGEPLVKDGYTAGKLVSGDKIIEVKVPARRRMQEMQKMYHIMQKYAETVQIRRKITQSAMPMVR